MTSLLTISPNSDTHWHHFFLASFIFSIVISVPQFFHTNQRFVRLCKCGSRYMGNLGIGARDFTLVSYQHITSDKSTHLHQVLVPQDDVVERRFIHHLINVLNVRPHHRKGSTSNGSQKQKSKQRQASIHSALPLGRTSSGNTNCSCGWSTGAIQARRPSFKRMFLV